MHVYLLLITCIYADMCVYRCILACIWSRSTSLLPPARRVAHDSKGAYAKLPNASATLARRYST